MNLPLALLYLTGLAAAVGAAPCTLSSQALITFCTATRTECLAEAESSTAPSFSTNLLQCYCNLQTCYDHPEAPCDEIATQLEEAQQQVEYAYRISPITCRGMQGLPQVEAVFGASRCSATDVTTYLTCTGAFDECTAAAGISLSPTAILTIDAQTYKAYAQCYCRHGLICGSSIGCEALQKQLAASAPELPQGVSCSNVDIAPPSEFEVVLSETLPVDLASVPPATTCGTKLQGCAQQLESCAAGRGRSLNASDLAAVATVPPDAASCFCRFFDCRDGAGAQCQQRDSAEVARLRAVVGDCRAPGSGAIEPGTAIPLVTLLAVMVAAAMVPGMG
eukprot:jgi/Tetstr1/420913/TSEL_011975.t1